MAEYLAKEYVKQNNLQDIEIASCGVMCSYGKPISEMSAKALEEIGITVTSHKSNMITLKELMEYDFIFVMTNSHKAYLNQALNAGENVIVLGEFVGMGEVPDPYGGSLDDYINCRNMLKVMVDKVFEKLNKSN